MPTIKRFHRCRIEMYFGDHNPPHFHIITTGAPRVTVTIEKLTVLAGMANQRDITEAIEWARANRELLSQRWSMYSETES